MSQKIIAFETVLQAAATLVSGILSRGGCTPEFPSGYDYQNLLEQAVQGIQGLVSQQNIEISIQEKPK